MLMGEGQLKNIIKDEEIKDLLFAIEQASPPLIPKLKSATRINDPQVSAITISELRSRKRITEFIFSRMIFSHLCRDQYTLQAIADYLGLKSHASICKYLENFQWDVRYVSGFRQFYIEVSRIIEGIRSQRELGQRSLIEKTICHELTRGDYKIFHLSDINIDAMQNKN